MSAYPICEALWALISEAKCPDGFAKANDKERASHLAPIIERALDTVIDKMVEYYDFNREMPKEMRDRWHAQFTEALTRAAEQ